MKDALGLTKVDYKRIKIQQKIDNLLNSKCMMPIYTLYFGYNRAKRLNHVRHNRMMWLDECYEILSEDFADFINQYQFSEPTNRPDKKYIWICWLQGEKFMPDVVKCCVESVKRNAPKDSEVILITSDNLNSFVEFPLFIYGRLKYGSLNMTHFSDMIRMALLEKYGGLWIDSTVFVSSEIPKEYLEKDLYTIQVLDKKNRMQNPYYGGITSFLIGGNPKCMLFDFCLKFFIEYQKKIGRLLDGHLINLCYRLAYDYFSDVRDYVDSIGINNNNVQLLYNSINSPYNEEQWNSITRNQIFHKLNWRVKYREKENGIETMYGHIKNMR